MPRGALIPRGWTGSQRGVVIGFVVALAIGLLIRLKFNPTYISDPQPAQPARFNALADRLDPNTATWQDLAVLPQLGESRAKDVIAYREEFVAAHPGELAFNKLEDLLRIKGFGVAMIQTLNPYLMFSSTNASTRPATTRGV